MHRVKNAVGEVSSIAHILGHSRDHRKPTLRQTINSKSKLILQSFSLWSVVTLDQSVHR